MFTPSSTLNTRLKLTESIAESDSYSSTNGEEELEGCEDDHGCQLKLYSKITVLI